jgi:hypothetical protein
MVVTIESTAAPPPMPFRRIALLGLALVSLGLPRWAHATTVVAPEFNDLVNQADYIVRASVKSVTAEWRENQGRKYIASQVALEIIAIIRGLPPQPLVLELVGGRVGAEELVIEGAPQFLVGDDVILFVQGNGRQIYPLVAIMHGLYPVVQVGKSQQEYVLRSNGLPIYHEQDVSLPIGALSAAKAVNPAALPMTAAAFISKIRMVPAATRRNVR